MSSVVLTTEYSVCRFESTSKIAESNSLILQAQPYSLKIMDEYYVLVPESEDLNDGDAFFHIDRLDMSVSEPSKEVKQTYKKWWRPLSFEDIIEAGKNFLF